MNKEENNWNDILLSEDEDSKIFLDEVKNDFATYGESYFSLSGSTL